VPVPVLDVYARVYVYFHTLHFLQLCFFI